MSNRIQCFMIIIKNAINFYTLFNPLPFNIHRVDDECCEKWIFNLKKQTCSISMERRKNTLHEIDMLEEFQLFIDIF